MFRASRIMVRRGVVLFDESEIYKIVPKQPVTRRAFAETRP